METINSLLLFAYRGTRENSVGQKAPFKLKEIWVLVRQRVRIHFDTAEARTVTSRAARRLRAHAPPERLASARQSAPCRAPNRCPIKPETE
jgi:hypothetical protein